MENKSIQYSFNNYAIYHKNIFLSTVMLRWLNMYIIYKWKLSYFYNTVFLFYQ